MLSIQDVVDLAKAGYKPADVKELMELSKTQDVPKDEPQPTPQPDPAPQPEPAQPDKPSETPPEESGQPDGAVDYKALYEAEKAKVESLQDKNNNRDVSGQGADDPLKELMDVVRDYC